MVVTLAFCERVAPDPGSATLVRNQLQDQLEALDAPRLVVADATHVLYELVMNGVEHGRPGADGRIEVSWSVRRGRLEMSVHDAGSPEDGRVIAPRAPTPDLPGGRGLLMVEAFTECWHADRSDGTRVTAWVALPDAEHWPTALAG